MRIVLQLVVVLTLAVASAGAASAAPGDLSHVAGTPGEGSATAIAQTPSGVAVVGDRLVVADALFGAVREVSLSSGAQVALHQPVAVPPVARFGGPSIRTFQRAQPFPQVLAEGPDGAVYAARRRTSQVVRIAADGTERVIAGTGVPGGLGDGGPATVARLAWPEGVAVDRHGVVYVADTANHRIRRIDRSGTITTVAGTGARGFSGDGGPARSARLASPTAVAVGAGDVLYVVDTDNRRIRRITPEGVITTLAAELTGAGHGGTERCADRPAATVPVGEGAGLAVDGRGRLLHLDGYGCLYRFEGDGRATWIAGAQGVAGGTHADRMPARQTVLVDAGDIAVGPDGSVYVAAVKDAVVRRIRPDGMAVVVAGRLQGVTDPGGTVGLHAPRHGSSGDAAPARSSQLAHVTGMAVDGEGGVVLSEGLDNLVRRIEPDGIVVRTVAGLDQRSGSGDGGPAVAASVQAPRDVAAGPDGALLIVEETGVRRIGRDGLIGTLVRSEDSGPCREDTEGAPAATTAFRSPSAVDLGPDGSVYIAESWEGRVRRIDAGGRIRTVLGEARGRCSREPITPDARTPVPAITGLAVGPDATVYVTNSQCLWRVDGPQEATCLVPLSSSLPQVDDGGPFIDDPAYVSVWGVGDPDLAPDVVVDGEAVLVSDPVGGRVLRWTPHRTEVLSGTGAMGAGAVGSPAAGSPLALPTALALAPGGAVLVYEAGTHRILRIDGEPVATPVSRLAGPDRISTSVEISRDDLQRGSGNAAVLARADDFADALAGTPLAAAQGGPLLLTPTGGLDPRVEAELRRVVPEGRTVYLLGGERALSAAVQRRVAALGYQPVRIAGPDRFATAVAIAERTPAPRTVFVTTGGGFADALAAGAAAATEQGVVLLTAGDTLPQATAAYLRSRTGTPVTAVGGPAARAVPTARPLVGRTRYQTAALVADAYFTGAERAVVASGVRFPDALSAGAHAARHDAPLLLSGPDTLADETAAWLHSNRGQLERAHVAGGASALSADVRRAVQNAVR